MQLIETIGLFLIAFISTWPLCIESATIGISQEYMNTVTQKGLDYVRAIGIPFLVKELNSLKIPDVLGNADTPLGSINFGLTKISLSCVGIPKSNLTINQKKGLTISAGNATLNVQANWRYRQEGWPHISDSGTTELRLKQIHLELTLKVAIYFLPARLPRLASFEDAVMYFDTKMFRKESFRDTKDESNPQMRANDCNLNVGALKLRFHGGASWLYNLFADPISMDLKGTLEKEVCRSMVSAIDREGNKLLAKLPNIIKNIEMHLKSQQKDEIEDNEF